MQIKLNFILKYMYFVLDTDWLILFIAYIVSLLLLLLCYYQYKKKSQFKIKQIVKSGWFMEIWK